MISMKNGSASFGSSKTRSTPAMKEVIAHPSAGTIAKAFAGVLIVALFALMVYMLSNILVLFFLGVFVATIIDPGVQAMRKWGIPSGIGILIHYIVFFTMAFLLLLSFVPILAEQVTGLAAFFSNQVNYFLSHPAISVPLLSPEMNAHLSLMVRSALQHESIQQFPDALLKIGQYLSTASSLKFATDIVGSVFTFIFDTTMVLLFAFFLEVERMTVLAWFTGLFPFQWQPYLRKKAGQIRQKLEQWAKGQLLLCVCMGVLVFIVLLLLQMPYALTLALLAAFTEFIPYVGPLIAAIPAVLIALASGGFAWALLVIASYILMHWSENNIIVPLIMKYAVDVSAVAIMAAMLIGISFPNVIHPILGILLSIPVTSIIGLFLDDLRSRKVSAIPVSP
jgi:predicted PurR-regulated permease PerM